jgi:hypothetical protein
VESVSPAGAVARLEGEAVASAGRWRAIEERRPAGRGPLAVFVDHVALAAELGRFEACAVERAPGAGRYVAALERGRLVLRSPAGRRLWLETETEAGSPGRITAAARTIGGRLDQERTRRAWLLLAQAPASLALEARLEAGPAGDRERRGTRAPSVDTGLRPTGGTDGAPGHREYEAYGDAYAEPTFVALVVTNPGADPVHLTVLSVSETEGGAVIWPPAGTASEDVAEVTRIAGGAERTLPVAVPLDREGSLQRPVRTRYVVVATRSPVDVAALRGGAAVADSSSALVRLAWPDAPTAAGDVELDPSAMGIRVVDLVVRRRTPYR